MTITLELPYPPSSNRYLRKFRNKIVKTEEAKKYQEAVGLLARAEIGEIPFPKPMRVGVSMQIRRPAAMRDIDNHQKVMFDALQGVVYENDGQIFKMDVDMVDDKKNPGITVTVWEIK